MLFEEYTESCPECSGKGLKHASGGNAPFDGQGPCVVCQGEGKILNKKGMEIFLNDEGRNFIEFISKILSR